MLYVCTRLKSVYTELGFGDFVDRIYPIELEIKDTTHTGTSASYLDLHLVIDSEGRLTTKLSHCELFIHM